MKKTLLLTLLSVIGLGALAQSAGDFRSRQIGNWNANSTWERYNGTAWVDATGTPSSTDGVITIRSPHVVTVTANVTVDQTVIESGGEVVVNAGVTLSVTAGPGDDLVVNGTLQNNGLTSIQSQAVPPPPQFGLIRVNGLFINGNTINGATSSTLFFGNGSTYRHAQDGGILPLASWNQNSTCSITGIVSTPLVSGINQNFGNFSWNCASQTGFIDLDGNLTTVNGNLDLLSSGGAGVYLTATSSYILNIGGNITIDDYFGFNSTAPNVELNVGGDYNLTGIIDFTFSGDITLNIDGNFITSGGTMNLTYGGDANITINLKSDFELDPSTSVTQAGGTGTKYLNFIGVSPQIYSASTAFTEFDYIVKPNAIVTLDNNSFFAGSGDVVVENLGELRVGSTDTNGAIRTGTSSGNIRVSGARNFAAGSKIVYNGAAAQVIGTGFPTGGTVNLEIDNAAGVAMNGNLTISTGYELGLTNGPLVIGGNTLTLNGDLTGTGTLTGGNTANLSIDGAGDPINLNFTNTPGTLNNLTINRDAESPIILGGDLQVRGTFTTTKGKLDISGRNFQISGPYAGGAAELLTDASTVLRVNTGGSGDSFSGTLNIESGNELGTWRINRPNITVSTTSSPVVSTLELQAGILDNSDNSILMAPGGTVIRDEGGSMVNAPGGTNPYNVLYRTGSFSTGPELKPSPETLLNNLTVAGSGTYTIGEPFTLYGEVNLNSGSLANTIHEVTMKGVSWNFNGGAYSPGASRVVFDGNTTIGGSGIKQFHSLRVLNDRTLSLPGSAISLSGNYRVDATGVVQHNNGTVILNGGVDQELAAGGSSLYNVTVNKPLGVIVNNTSTLNLIGALQLNSPTEYVSNGNLTLISTGDDGLSDARIAALPSGASVTGNVIVQRYMSGKGWISRIITPTVQNVAVKDWQNFFKISGNFTDSDPSVTGDPSMYYYDETVIGDAQEGWIAYPTSSNTEELANGLGYLVFMSDPSQPVNIEVSGPVIQGTFDFVSEVGVTYSSSGNSDNDGWNLLGNPFPSQIDWSETEGWTRSTTIDNMVYIEDDAAGITRFWNGSTGSFNGYIAMGQGFWIKTNGNPITMVINENAKSNDVATFYRRESPANHMVITLRDDDANLEDYTYLHYRPDATNGHDHFADGYKRQNLIFSVYTLGEDQSMLAINSRKLEDYISDTVGIGISDIEPGQFQLIFDDLQSFEWSYLFILHDKFTEELVEIQPENGHFVYTFEVTDDVSSWGNDRFEIIIKPIFTGLTFEDDYEISIYPNPSTGTFSVKGVRFKDLSEAYILDTRGVIINIPIFADGTSREEVIFEAGGLSRGIYMLRLNLRHGVVTRKLVIE